MNFFLAQAAPQTSPYAGILSMLPMLVFIFLFYYLFIAGPMRKKQKQFQQLMSNLKTGDRVVTNSGIYGVITGISDKTLKLRIANNVVVEMDKSAIGGLATEEKEEKK
jgi:preprotein translocase subunit YajC